MINTVTIIGNLGRDPEIRYSPKGTPICNMSIAVSEAYKDGDGNKLKRTHWFRAVAFGRTAEVASEYLEKGSKVGIRGMLQYREWEDTEGNKRSTVEIRVRELELLGENGNGHAEPETSEGNSDEEILF